MGEPIFNLFLIIDDDQVIVELGVSVHQFRNDDVSPRTRSNGHGDFFETSSSSKLQSF